MNCSYNQLTNLNFLNDLRGERLTNLFIHNNNIASDLAPLRRFVNLKELWINSNPFCGGLEPLQDLVELRKLNISDTDINSGLEYLPESVGGFDCSVKKRTNAKCQTLYNLFADEKGKAETDYDGIINFPQKLQDYKSWRKFDFAEEEIEQWINAGLKLNENELANILKQESYQPNTPNIQEITRKESWRNIHPSFNYQLKKGWGKTRLDYAEIKKWINAGAKADDYKFVIWLKDVKKETPEWIINYKEDYQLLSERFKEYGLCFECNQPNTGKQWCRSCNAQHFQQNFYKWYKWNKWTSHNSKIDQFIQKCQLEATDKDKLLEWIPYDRFKIEKDEDGNNKVLGEGGFGKVYKAKWIDGPIEKRDVYKEKVIAKWISEVKEQAYIYVKDNGWKRYGSSEVALKIIKNSQDLNIDFLQETANHKIVDDWFQNIVPCYGLSQDPQGNYIMVMQCLPEGNMRSYLSNKNRELSLKDKISQLHTIVQGLKDIHAKNLVHQDFHSGNILKGIQKTDCLITDLGLCKPANEVSQEKKIFGVMPYVAPEVLRSQPYTQASDIYSWGIIAYEILSSLPPYYDREHNVQLGLDICNGLRPKLQIKIPLLLESLIKRCWNIDPSKRPTANELEKILRVWKSELERDLGKWSLEITEFIQQTKEAEEFNKDLPDDIKFPDYKNKIHSGAIYTSKLLPTKEITKLITEQYSNSLEAVDFTKLNLEESQQNQEQQALQIQPTIPPFNSNK